MDLGGAGRRGGTVHCYCRRVSMGVIAQYTTTFHLHKFFSVMEDLQGYSALL